MISASPALVSRVLQLSLVQAPAMSHISAFYCHGDEQSSKVSRFIRTGSAADP